MIHIFKHLAGLGEKEVLQPQGSVRAEIAGKHLPARTVVELNEETCVRNEIRVCTLP